MKCHTVGRGVALVLSIAAGAAPAAAQHDHAASPYAHTQSGELPTLTPEEVTGLRNGEGMGLARPAELNHFPGPKHLLELAEELELTEAQVAAVREIREAMSAAAIAKGEEILTAERHLAELFAAGEPTAEALDRITGHLGTMRGELQAIHLRAHIEAKEFLTAEQVEAYHRLRGYSPNQ